ncbi:MAG: hypothetical protein U0893_00195 [Chloroflexota bacterium]
MPSFELPPHVDLTPKTLRAIAARHGLDISAGVERLPLPMLPEIMRFFADPPDERWRAVGPAPRMGGADHA